MAVEIIVAVISAAGGIIVGGISIAVSKSIISYRIEQLERKVEKHNHVIERTLILEQDVKSAFRMIGENRDDLKELEKKI